MRWGRFLGAFACAAMTASCGSEMKGDLARRITTEVDPTTIMAGGTAAVTCTIYDYKDDPLTDGQTFFTVDPDAGGQMTATAISPTIAGTHVLRCASAVYKLTDEDGAILEVTPAEPRKVTAVLAKNPVAVYELTTVDCIVQDEFGNEVDTDTSVSGSPGLIIDDHAVGSENVGTYDVECHVPGYDGIPSETATLEVTPDEPANVELLTDPDPLCFGRNQPVTLYWVVTDQYGNEIADVPGTLTVPTTNVEVVDEEAHRYRHTAEGEYTYSVTLDEEFGGLTDDLVVTVDKTGPEITIEWPPRGSTIMAEDGGIEVVGEVTDSVGDIATFTINDIPVDVAANGSFSFDMDPTWGINILMSNAKDACGNGTKISPTFQYSTGWTSFVDQDVQGVKTLDALELLLGQMFLDDGVHDHEHVNDLATLLEVVIGDLDVGGLLGQLGELGTTIPVFQQPVLDLGFVKLSIGGWFDIYAEIIDPSDLGPTSVTLDSRTGGIDASLVIGDLFDEGLILTIGVDLIFTLVVDWQAPLVGTGQLETNAGAEVESVASADFLLFDFGLDIDLPPGGDPQTDLTVDLTDFSLLPLDLQIDPFDDLVLVFTLDLPDPLPDVNLDFNLTDLVDLNALTDFVLDPLTTQLVPLLSQLIEPVITFVADDLLKQLILALELNLPVELPPIMQLIAPDTPPGPDDLPLLMDLYTNLSSVTFTEDGGQIGLSLGAYTDKGIDREPLGAIRRDGCLKDLPDELSYSWDRSVGVAAKTDAVNAAIFAVWWSGYLNGPLDLGPLLSGTLPIPLDDVKLDLDFLLPLELNDCRKTDAIEAEIGDLYAELTGNVFGFDIEAGIYLDAAASIFFDSEENGISVTVGEFRYFDVEVVYVSDQIAGLIDIRDLLENQLQPLLESYVVGQTFGPIEIPAIDLGGLLPGVLPPGIVLQIGDLSVEKESGYIVGGANLK